MIKKVLMALAWTAAIVSLLFSVVLALGYIGMAARTAFA